MSFVAQALDAAQAPDNPHQKVIAAAIEKAPDSIAEALTLDVYKALAALQADPRTHGLFLQLVDALKKANKSITRRDLDDGIKKATSNDPLDELDDELRHGVEPWPDAVEGAVLYKTLCLMLTRHCVLPVGGASAIALWLMAAYSINSFRVFSKLLIQSPQKRCGKTTLLEVLQGLMPQALSGSNVTPSVIFRAIELWQVSILLDEVDTFLHNSDDLRGIVNSGHTRSGAHVWRTEGEAIKEPRRFSTWAPMVLAMIGNPPSTILDRSVRIGLVRKTTSDTVERIPQSFAEDCLPIRRQLTRWAEDAGPALMALTPTMPAHENDRALDNWTALFSVASLVGADADAQQAMTALEVITDDGDDLSIELLRDVNDLIQRRVFIGVIRASKLADHLISLDGRPWTECNRGKAITANKLAYLLKPYGIKAENRRLNKDSQKTYVPDDFTDAIARYLPESGQLSNKALETHSEQRLSVTEPANTNSNVTEQFGLSVTKRYSITEQMSNEPICKESPVTPQPTSGNVSQDCYPTGHDFPESPPCSEPATTIDDKVRIS